MIRKVASPFLIAVVISLSACGSSEKTEVTNILVSPEQQKADLQRAHDQGIISDEEYKQEVSEIGQ